jgi:hypothetical protein
MLGVGGVEDDGGGMDEELTTPDNVEFPVKNVGRTSPSPPIDPS